METLFKEVFKHKNGLCELQVEIAHSQELNPGRRTCEYKTSEEEGGEEEEELV